MYKRVIIVTGAQSGKTDTMINVMLHRLDDDPVPILYVGPTKSQVEKVIEKRITKAIKSCDSLAAKQSKVKRGSKVDKTIAGVTLRLVWSGSAVELASQEAGLVEVDELDKMTANVRGEGDPFGLAEQRLATYADGKIIGTSTPTLGNIDETYDAKTRLTRWAYALPEDVQSPIWKLWQEGTRFEWAWPCPSCKDYFIPRSSTLWYPKDFKTTFEVKRLARVECPHCSFKIDDGHKTEMNARGTFVAPGQWIDKDGTVYGNVEPNDTASYWVSGLCSPWVAIGTRAKNLVDAEKSGEAEKLQVVYNSQLGQLYKVGGAAKPWEELRQLILPYEARKLPDGFSIICDQIPTGVMVITCGVDVQKDRLVWAMRGWGYASESWGLGYGEIWGETEYNPVWTRLGSIIEKPIGGMYLKMIGIDSGYRPGDKHKVPDNQIYKFCRKYPRTVVPTKGQDRMEKPLHSSLIDVKVDGRLFKQGLQLWHIDTDYFKSWLMGRYDWPATEPGGFHCPQGTEDKYFMQMSSEGRVVKPSGQAIWVRVRKDNHLFDAETINVALAHILQVPLLAEPKSDRVESLPARTPASVPKQPQPRGVPMQRIVRHSKYMTRRR